LQREGWPVCVSVVSSYGADGLNPTAGSEVITGRLDQPDLKALLKSRKISVLVDATHPFASQISLTAMQAAEESGVSYVRLERPACPLPASPLVKKVERVEDMEGHFNPGQRIFSTLGSKELESLLPMVKRKKAELVVRVLPMPEVISKCIDLGVKAEHIVAMQGPFSVELNRQLLLHYHADCLLTKESGSAGGLDSKLRAALELEIPVLVWTRPALDYPLVLTGVQEAMDYLSQENTFNSYY
jgi:precorrin-6A/cobalt-precorrin-6A reductase